MRIYTADKRNASTKFYAYRNLDKWDWNQRRMLYEHWEARIESLEANVNATVKGNRKEVTQWKAIRNQQSKGQRQIEPLTVSLIL